MTNNFSSNNNSYDLIACQLIPYHNKEIFKDSLKSFLFHILLREAVEFKIEYYIYDNRWFLISSTRIDWHLNRFDLNEDDLLKLDSHIDNIYEEAIKHLVDSDYRPHQIKAMIFEIF